MLRLIGPAIEILGFYFLFGAKDKPRSIGGVPTEKLLWGVLAVGLSMVVIGILLSSKRPKIS